MADSLYQVELYGGPYDGYRKLSSYVPAREELEFSLDDLPGYVPTPAPLAARTIAVYRQKRSQLCLVEGLPTISFRYEFSGTKEPPGGEQGPSWRIRIRRLAGTLFRKVRFWMLVPVAYPLSTRDPPSERPPPKRTLFTIV